MVDLDLNIDSLTLRMYLKLIVLGHAATISGLVGAAILVSSLAALRTVGAVLMFGGLLLYCLCVTVFALPLCVRVLRGKPFSLVRLHHSLNIMNGDGLLSDERCSESTITPSRIRRVVLFEIILVPCILLSMVIGGILA